MTPSRPASPARRIIEDAERVEALLRRHGKGCAVTIATWTGFGLLTVEVERALAYLLGAAKVIDTWSVVHGRYVWEVVS